MPPHSYDYMRRRKRSSDNKSFSRSRRIRNRKFHSDIDEAGQTSAEQKANLNARDRFVLKLSLNAKNKTLRKQLKRKFRKKAKQMRNIEPPWSCYMEPRTLSMEKGHFPPWLSTGKCIQKKCFYRLYNCEEEQYMIKVLKRDPEHCNPVPTISNETVYEERWNLEEYPIVVGCKCASLSGGRKY